MVDVQKVSLGGSSLPKNKSKGRYLPASIQPVAVDPQWISKHWFIVATNYQRVPPNQKCVEVQAHEALAELGVTSWYGVTKERLSGRRKQFDVDGKVIRTVNRLTFPGYLFVADCTNFHRVVNVKQISCVLGLESTRHGFVPTRVPSAAMQALFAGDEIRNCGLQVGESVEVIEGHFANFDTEISKIITADRIEIVLDFMGSKRPVEISVDKIRKL